MRVSVPHSGRETEARSATTVRPSAESATRNGRSVNLPSSERAGHAASILGGVLIGAVAGLALDTVLALSFPDQAHAFVNLYQFDMSHGAPLSFIGGPEATPLVLPALGGFIGSRIASK